MKSAFAKSRTGLVAIGRNEGERLRSCLKSACEGVETVVYVDSGSTDGSVELARDMDVEVVQLDLTIPFTAARARNAGFERIIQLDPELNYVQFVDGDCEVVTGWLQRAGDVLGHQAGVAVVTGRRRERYPDRTIYNRLCDIEWERPAGETKSCGGDAMIRVEAFRQVGGYNPAVIAGEEPELCVRLRQNGWKILRLNDEMTWHDAQITFFWQWWKRTIRSGHAYAQGAAMHGKPPERHGVRESLSIWLWGFWLPLIAVLLAWPTRGASFLLLLGYLLLAARMVRHSRAKGFTWRDTWLYTCFTILGKFPQALGQWKFLWSRWLGKTSRLIEYKHAQPT